MAVLQTYEEGHQTGKTGAVMIVYLSLTLVTLAIAFLIKSGDVRPAVIGSGQYNYIYRGISRKQVRNVIGLFSLFVLLSGVSAIRLNVGNDYSNYVEFMHRTFSNAYVPTEPGFNYLTKFVYTLSGFENYVAVFAIFAAATVFFFLSALYRQSEDFFLSFIMFMLLGYYFQSLSTVRYYLALAVALYSIRFCLNGDWPRFIILILCGALFHKSLIVVLVLYPLASMKWKRWMYIVLSALCFSCIFLKDVYLVVATKLYPSYEGTEYLSGGTSAIGIARCVAVLLLAVFVLGKNIVSDKKLSFYFYSNLGALLLYVFCSFLPTVSRITYYFMVTQILYVPALLKMLMADPDYKRYKAGQMLKVLTVVGCVLYFIMYMRGAANDGVRILPYETIFFHELPATLSERGFG
ncbi:EpsG family protein [Butyrivibrio sp. AD3002]|uniref:EpsG family protein n=1 Tax=Butyrivibrio sp. AD3002 TaxID=1280670 RepID=UPI001FA7BC6A|nr:EpsG family protein [Butyrivibrio sp. AD3002]